jgi:hypothetical protein
MSREGPIIINIEYCTRELTNDKNQTYNTGRDVCDRLLPFTKYYKDNERNLQSPVSLHLRPVLIRRF